MKKIIVLLFSSLLVLAAGAQDNTAVAADVKKADPLGLSEIEFNFGKIPQGKPVTHVFEVVNSGADSLRISNVQASCGCTTPEWEREKTQAPGEKTKITVGYNAASEGPFNKTITISYNGNMNKVITIKGEVWKTALSSAPENKDLGSLKEL
jgi:hypothetical protein